MKTIGLIIKKNDISDEIREEDNKLTKETSEKQTKDKVKKPSAKTPKTKKPPETKVEEPISETVDETDAPEETKVPENGAD